MSFVILIVFLCGEGRLADSPEIRLEGGPTFLGGCMYPRHARAAYSLFLMVVTSDSVLFERAPLKWVLPVASDDMAQVLESSLT